MRKKKVLQCDLNGNVIREFNSVAEASKITGLNKTSIAKVCRGERLICSGHVFKYLQE